MYYQYPKNSVNPYYWGNYDPRYTNYPQVSYPQSGYPIYQQNYSYEWPAPPQTEGLSRGSWTPFPWVENYAYAFSGPYNKAEVSLTFDDGPDSVYTAKILDTLNKYGVKGTFFLLGQNVEKYPDVVKRIAAEGHIIGNHSYSHPDFVKLSDEEYHEQVTKTERLIKRLVGYEPKFMRPPYGSINEKQLAWATNRKMMIVQWTVDTLDWKTKSAQEIADKAVGNSFPGSVILQHSGPGLDLQGSLESLDKTIPQLTSKGARFVTLPQMFNTTKERK